MTLSNEDKNLLLKLAKAAIISEFDNTEIDAELLESVKKFDIKKGVFVTINRNGQLRGCIGQIIPILPLWHAIIETAKSAAFHDPRFDPIERADLPFLKIEISILSPLNKVIVAEPEEYLKNINIGTQGIFIESSTGHSGLLLPQVFLEHGITDVSEALQMTCQKANLFANEWKKPGVSVYTFEAEIFNE